MIKVLFICHGNICRSPMAEFVLKDMVKTGGISDRFYIASAATSTEEIGNPVHYGTVNKLREVGISTAGKCAVQLRKADYDKYDYLIGMDRYNIRNIERMTGHRSGKIFKLLEFTGSDEDVADPWYTHDFDRTYEDIVKGCEGFLDYLKERGEL
ncbi:MAG: low molecular weight protein-tyrosine-phosphatase [Schaedlerella sp.]|nr:low molecular weight phosphotyrosine protein phosphatase [Lachnospiraceae bacterium]MDY4202160.1 low molecular weight protein-tyrosine-phosphatase [Schaedlerella sp.]